MELLEDSALGQLQQRIALTTNRHVLIGFSVFNSYYSEERMNQIIAFFQKFDFRILLPDSLTCLNNFYVEKYKKKIQNENNRLYNRTVRSLQRFGFDPADKLVILSEKIEPHPLYQQYVDYYTQLLQTDIALKQAVDATIQELSFYNADSQLSYNYILRELPTLLNMPSLLNLPEVCTIYHRTTPLFDYLFSNNYQEKGQSFVPMYFALDREKTS